MIKSLVLFVLSTIICVSSYAQCEEEYGHICKEKLKGDHYTPLLTKEVDNHEGDVDKLEYAYQFTKGVSYEFYYDGEMEIDHKLNVTLYNYNHDLVLANDKHEPHKVVYKCKHTGIYYLSFQFDDHESYCGTVGLGYVSR